MNNNPNLESINGFYESLIKIEVEHQKLISFLKDPKKRRNFAKYIQLGCTELERPKDLAKLHPPSICRLANFILGKDYISPEEVAGAYGFSFSKKQLAHFSETFPDLDTLLSLHDSGYILLPGPPRDQNLLQVEELNSSIFASNYIMQQEYYNDFIEAGEWLAIRKVEIPGSTNRTWIEQKLLLSSNESVPNISEISYAIAIFSQIRNIRLFSSIYLRTSSFEKGACVYLLYKKGRKNENLYYQSDYGENGRFDDVGITTKWNFC